jgi:hypothetical protein
MKLPAGYRTATPDGLKMTVYDPNGEVVARLEGEGLALEAKAEEVAKRHAGLSKAQEHVEAAQAETETLAQTNSASGDEDVLLWKGGLPEGYELESARGWHKVLGPDGEQVGKSARSAEEAIASALKALT